MARAARVAPAAGARIANVHPMAKPVAPENPLDRWYLEHYDAIVHSGASGFAQRMFHVAIERPWGAASEFATVLDLGATTGEHLRFVRHRFSRYIMIDHRDSAEARQ